MADAPVSNRVPPTKQPVHDADQVSGVVARRDQAAAAETHNNVANSNTRVNVANIATSGVDEDALTTSTPGQRLLNFGRLTTTGDLADGIFADAGDVTIRNFRTVETSGQGAAGVFVLGDDARIQNYGSVTTHGGLLDPDPDEEGDESFSEGMTAIGDRFQITNLGRVSVEGESSSAMSGIGADGLIVNYGRAESSADGSSLIGVFGDRSQVVNAGVATTRATDIAALFALGEEATARNVGLILATGTNSTGIEGVLTNTNLVNAGTIRVDGDQNFGMAGFGDGHELANVGLIVMRGDSSSGMGANGDPNLETTGADLTIRNAGRIDTEGELSFGAVLGVSRLGYRPAIDGTILNTGVIEAAGDGSAGVVMVGDGHHLINSGRITSDGGAVDSDAVGVFRAAGVVVVGDQGLVENARLGAIRSNDGASAGVDLNVVERDGLPAADMSAQLENAGLVSAPDVAVLGGAGQETVINRGRIIGDVSLGGGDDTFVFGRGGSVRGEVRLGTGEDVVRVENGSGLSRVADFAAGDANDAIDVSGFFSSFDDVLENARQRGQDVIIKLDRNDTLVLKDVDLSTLTQSDFIV